MLRGKRTFVAAFAATLLAVLGATTGEADAAARGDQFGLSAGGRLHNLPPAELARELDAYRDSGARWVRIDLNWAVVQAGGPQRYNWAPFDAVIRGARARGLRVVGVVSYSPPWARASGTPAVRPPRDPLAYARFAGAAARRYARLGVRHWQIWNEPNIAVAWGGRANPTAYARLLKPAYAAIKRGNRAAVVITAGLSPARTGGGDMAPIRFLRGLYAARAHRSFDALAHHASTFPAFPATRAAWSPWHQMARSSPSLRSVMVRNGDRRKKIWVTEYSAPTQSARAVRERTQAAMLRQAYTLIGRYRWAGPLFWYSFRDVAPSSHAWQDVCGLVRYDFSPKLAYASYRALANASR